MKRIVAFIRRQIGDPMFDRVEVHDRFFSPGGEAELAIHCERGAA